MSNSLNSVCYMYKIGKSDLPHLSPQCVKKVVHSHHHQDMHNLANETEGAIHFQYFKLLHSHSFFNSTQFEDILIFFAAIIIYLFVYMYQEYDQ